MSGKGGTNPGKGGTSPQDKRDRTADLFKEDWGHLPTTVRAKMNAYSNPNPFMPKYDELIKRYYRTLAASNPNNQNNKEK